MKNAQHLTFNIQRPTLKWRKAEHWVLNVECWLLNVFHFVKGTCSLAILLASTTAVFSQAIPFSTLAGYAGRGGSDGSGSNARFNHPHGMAKDSAGNFYIADTENHTIRKMTATGVVTTVAGLAGSSGSTDDVGNDARFFQPQGVAVDAAGNIFVADTGNHTIRKIIPGGTVTTIAGSPGIAGFDNGDGGDARFNQPTGIAVNNSGIIYVADFGNGAIRKIVSDSTVSTFAIVGGPQALAVDASGIVYAADFSRSVILKITSGGFVSTLAGATNIYGSVDASGTNALFYQPAAVAVDNAANVYVADFFNNTIRRVTPSGAVTTLAGFPGKIGWTDGASPNALFHGPQGIAVDNATNVFVADTENGTIRKISPAAVVTTFAGSPSAAFADAMRGGARFNLPAAIAVDSNGNLVIADSQNSVIRKFSPGGDAINFAGFPGISGSADGNGSNARFSGPQSVAADSSGNIFVADTGNNTVRKISSLGIVSTLAGSAGNQGSIDGTGTNADFYQPQGIAADNSGNVFVSDTVNHTIRKITSAGVVTTIAGFPENFGGADGTNSNARFNWPMGLTVDGAGRIFVADYLNHAIRKITPQGTNWITSTVAGCAGISGKADGTNNNARFFQPRGVAIDAGGNLFVVDSGNHLVRKISASGTNWIVSTLAGFNSGSADGTGTAARFNQPSGIAIDSAGFLYVADSANNTIRVNRVLPPQLQIAFAANQTILSWSALASGFILETSSTVSPAAWTPVNGWTLSGDNFVLSTNASAGSGFFRLRQP